MDGRLLSMSGYYACIVTSSAEHPYNIIQPMEVFLDLLRDFSLVFLPLLVAMDPLAVVPFMVPFLGSLPPGRRLRVINTSVVTPGWLSDYSSWGWVERSF